MNSTKFPRGNLRKLWRAKTDKKRAFSTGSNGKTRAPEPAAALPECRPAPERWGSRRNCLCKKRQKPTKNPCSLPKTAVENLWKKKKSRKFRKKVCRRA